MKNSSIHFTPLQATGRGKKNDFIGEEVDLDAFFRNDPECMVSFTDNDESLLGSKHQTFIIQLIYAAYIQAPSIINRGAFLCALINALELRGTKTSIYAVLNLDAYEGDNIQISICLKKFSEYLDVSLLTFTLAHPSMARRLGFRHIEVLPHQKGEVAKRMVVGGSYGSCRELEINQKNLAKIFMEGESHENSLYIPMLNTNDGEADTKNIMESLKKHMRVKNDEIEG